MSSLLGNLIMETCTLPGTSSIITLAGAPTGRMPFSSRFSNGQSVYYFLHDGTNWETAKGTYGSGPPSTLTRPATVIANSSQTTARINFPGQTYVICEPPAQAWVTTDDFAFVLGTGAGVGGSGTYSRQPNGLITQRGSAVTGSNGAVNVKFPIVFPSACMTVQTTVMGATVFTPISVVISFPVADGFTAWISDSRNNSAFPNINFTWFAEGV